MVFNWSIAVDVLPMHISVDDILFPSYMNWSTDSKDPLFNEQMAISTPHNQGVDYTGEGI